MPKWAQALLALSIGASSFVASDALQVGAEGEPTVTGTVVDEATGEPIEGITVTVRQYDPEYGDPSGAWPLASDVSGPDGTYRISLDGSFFVPSLGHTLEAIDGADRYGARFLIPTDLGDGSDDVTIAMRRGGLIVGAVYEVGYDTPIEGVCPRVTDLDGAVVLPRDIVGICTDRHGRYQVPRLPAGDYLVTFPSPDPSRYGSVRNLPVTVVADESTVLNLELPDPTPTFITGVVTDAATGEPVEGVQIFADTMTPDGYYQDFRTDTDADGVFSIDVSGFGVSPVFVTVTDPSGLRATIDREPVFVQPGYTEAVQFAMQPAGAIEGVITAEGDGAYAYVCLLVRSVDRPWANYICADAAGRYQLGALQSGQYLIEVQGYLSTHSIGTVGPIDVVAGETTVVDIEVPRVDTRITGEVVDNETGRPIRGVVVEVSLPWGERIGSVRTGADGSFSVDVQPYVWQSSEFTVSVTDPRGRYRASGPIPVVVQQGYDEPIGIALVPATTRIVGEVTDSVSGEPIRGARVVVTPVGVPRVRLTDTTARDGSFAIDVERFLRSTRRFRVEISDPSGRYEASEPFVVVMQRGYDEAVGVTLDPVSAAPYSARFTRPSLDPPPAVNERRAGTEVLLEWRVADASGRAVTDPSVVSWVRYAPASCRSWAITGPSRRASSDDGLAVSRRGDYRFRWDTPGQDGCVVVTVTLVDGTELAARVRLAASGRPG